MINIITEANCVRINDSLIPKDTTKIIKTNNGVRLVFSSGDIQDINYLMASIDGVPASSLDSLFNFLKAQSF